MPKCTMPDKSLHPIANHSPDPERGAASTVITLLRMLEDACHDASAESESLRRENSDLREQLNRFMEGATTAVSGAHPSACSIETGVDLIMLSQDRVASHSGQVQRSHGRGSDRGSDSLKSWQEQTPLSMALEEAPLAEDEFQSAPTSASFEGDALRDNFMRSAPQPKSPKSVAHWQSEHQMQPCWDEQLVRDNSFSDLAVPSSFQVSADMLDATTVEEYEGFGHKFISYPGSPRRNVWDLIGFVFILYDMIVIPLQPFAPPTTWFGVAMERIVLLFWTINVFASLQVGYVEKGITVMSPLKIMKNYLSTWFWLDIVVLVPDWYFTIDGLTHDGGSNTPGNALKLLRMARLSKCLRLLRAAKLRTLMRSIKDQISSEYAGICLQVCKMVFVLLLVNHYIASFWFAIGNMESFDTSWVAFYNYDKEDWFSKYCVSLHWSLTQFTPASKVEVQPKNLVERCFAILVVIFALVGFSYILGSISGALSQLRAMGEDAEKQFWQVRRYFRQNSVSGHLSTRIQRYLEHAYAKNQSRTDLNNIRIFALLSENLRNELRLEVALPQLKAHPLFVKLSHCFMPTLRRISAICISYRSLAQGDVLFFPGENATHMYFMVSGLLEYMLSKAGETVPSEWVEGKEDWIAEPVLWLRSWYHRGTPAARVESEILLIHPNSFSETVAMNPAAFEVVSLYARRFVDWLTNKPFNSWSDIYQGEDLFEYFAGFCNLDPDEIEINMPRHVDRHFSVRK